MSGSVVAACACEHEYQDKKYGKGKRLHNVGDNGGIKCTVCGVKKGGGK